MFQMFGRCRKGQRSQGMLPLDELKRAETRKQRLFAFVLPAVLYFLGFAVYGLWPVGNKHLLAYDLYHQYAPFLLELRRKLLSGDCLFFSWNGGLGVNFYSFFTYYSASPFNLLTILLPAENITEAVTLITVLKLGFASLFFHDFLSGAFRRDDPLSPLFSTFFALSSWVYAYSWNIMWLDTLICLPIAALGLVEIIRDRRPVRFIAGISLMLLTNYYSGFFACLFLILYFFVLYIQFRPSSRRFIERVETFAVVASSALLSVLIAGVVLWPTLKALALTSAAGDAFPSGFTFSQAALKTLFRMTPLRSPNIMSGLPNIYAGIPALLLLPAFFFRSRRPLRVRITYGLLFGFLFFSMQSRTLSFIWHGAHYPNSLDFRYAFVFIFLTITMAYQAAGDDLAAKWHQMGATLGTIVFMLLVDQAFGSDDELSHWRILVMLAFGIGYLLVFRYYRPLEGKEGEKPLQGGVLFLKRRNGVESDRIRHVQQNQTQQKVASSHLQCSEWRKRHPWNAAHWPSFDQESHDRKILQRKAALALFYLMAFELLFQGFVSAVLYQKTAPLGDRQYYLANASARDIAGFADNLRAQYAGAPWRCEVLPDTCVNDPMLFGLPGFSLFSSPFPKASIPYFADLGYPINGVNSFQYKESTIVMDSLLAINHLIVQKDRIFDDRIRQETAYGTEMKLLTNPEALSFGYYVSSETGILNSESIPQDALDVQNRLLTAFGGEMNVLIKESFVPWTAEGCNVTREDDPYSFRVVREAGKEDWAFLVYDVRENGQYYIFWEDESCGINYANGFIRDNEFFHLGSQRRGIGDMGYLEKGGQIHFRVRMPSDKSVDGTFRAYIGRLEEQAWDKSRSHLASNPFNIEKFSSTSFSGTISAPQKGYLFLPVTGNPGWTFWVDGLKTPYETVHGSFMIVPLQAGKHVVSAKFVPQGFYFGLGMTLSGVLIASSLYFVQRRRRGAERKRRKALDL